MDIQLVGKQAFVCGSTQGIGKAVAMELAKMGAQVTLCARNESALATVAQELDRSYGQHHDYIVADFSQPDQLGEILEGYVSQTPTCHILINNTGGPAAGTAIDADPAAFLAAFQMHLICNQMLAQKLVPLMKQQRYGRIVNVISTSVKTPIAGLGVSNTIRGAVASWAKTLATELAPAGITVNNVLPGFTQTARLESLIATRAKNAGISIEQQTQLMQQAVPAKRFAQPEEVAAAVAFLASPAAAYITGINLPVDGGMIPTL